MIRWTEISSEPQEVRYKYLSKFLNDEGFENELTLTSCDSVDFYDKVKESMRHFDQILVGPMYGEDVLTAIAEVPADMLILKSADALIKKKKHWWARSILRDGLSTEVAHLNSLDVSGLALIVGANAQARAVVPALLRLGIEKFHVTAKYEEKGRRLVQDLKEAYFSAEFKFVPQNDLTLLPGIHSITVNTTPLNPENDILNELYYFNFLAEGGVVVDLKVIPRETPLLKAAKQVQGQLLHGYEVASFVDCYWAKEVFGAQLDQRNYEEGLKKVCNKIPFDFTPYEGWEKV